MYRQIRRGRVVYQRCADCHRARMRERYNTDPDYRSAQREKSLRQRELLRMTSLKAPSQRKWWGDGCADLHIPACVECPLSDCRLVLGERAALQEAAALGLIAPLPDRSAVEEARLERHREAARRSNQRARERKRAAVA